MMQTAEKQDKEVGMKERKEIKKEEIRQEEWEEEMLSDDELAQVFGGYYPQEYRDKKEKERVYT